MPGRVLNFLEFSDKYSNGNEESFSLDDMKNASSNFEEGFDDTTYDLPEIGAKRPISGNYEMTPAGPGEEGAPSFSEETPNDMSAPQENLQDEEEGVEEYTDDSDDEELEELEDDSEEEDEENEEEDEEFEEGNPEAGANPKKKVEEGFTLVKDFSQFVNEDNYGFEEEYYEGDDEHYGDEEDDSCPDCGEVPLSNEYGYSCGCNM